MIAKRIGACLALLGLAATPGFSQTIFTTGVIDVQRVYSSFFQESQAVRELEQLQQQYQRELEERANEIAELESDLADAQDENDEREVLQLQDRIAELTQRYDEYRQIRQRELQRRRDALTEGDQGFLTDLQDAVQFVAQERGYTTVRNMQDPDLIWWSREVDITADVLQRLRERN
jgi:outer membrane protein